ncbi:uncharacterized protein LOC125241899 [Leguminivora glycinivorella]|uniref:uncharacterized protein LOC125241899 n=1 Tax=Leguminivora glycinivorella TaxID=1035111 RepID=UPI00200BFF01|nr:uncharacterized protein LOC125241899 [Leguminivora glycinivorella]
MDGTKSKPQEKHASKKNKNEPIKNVANKPETKKAEDNANSINNKNIKDLGETHSIKCRNVGNTKPQIDRHVKNHANANDNTGVGNIKTTNKKNSKDNEQCKQTNKIVKNASDMKLANNKIFKDIGNITTANNTNVKDINVLKLTKYKIVKDDGKLLNSKDVSRNPLSNKKYGDLDNKQNVNNINKIDVNTMVQAAPRMDTPVKVCPAMRAMLSRSSRIDAFWDTDDSDHETAARRHAPPSLPYHHADLTQNQGTNPKQSGPGSQHASSTKLTKANKTLAVIPEKMVKNNNDTPNTSLKTRRRINLSGWLAKWHNAHETLTKRSASRYLSLSRLRIGATEPAAYLFRLASEKCHSATGPDALESANNSDLKENIPIKTKVQKKQKTEKKVTQDENNKTKATETTKSRKKKGKV